MKGVPIKFKAKAKRGFYVYGIPSADDDGVIRSLLMDVFYPDGVYYERVEIFPGTLPQLIGYDHFGNEVYEGDLLAEYYSDLPDTPKRKGRPKNERFFSPNLHCNLDLDDYVNVTGDYE